MKVGRKITFGLLMLTVGLISCKDENSSGFTATDSPEIEVLDIFPATLKQFEDSLTILVQFKDRNGDLGASNPNDPSLEIRDTRIENAELYHIPPITPDEMALQTQGTFQIVIPSLFLYGNGGAELTTFEIRVRDRESHWSNTVETNQIRITK